RGFFVAMNYYVEPGSFPLVDGFPSRAPLLRGYGNAIVIPQAQAFIEAFMELSEGVDFST
ncbi:MAG: hypothetical protein IK079_00135, partial [Desulfovibrio sp.]|nr:hypothetical protein [Desulfovibrio sp.]